jgi:thiol:disulfide interchange protein DsbD
VLLLLFLLVSLMLPSSALAGSQQVRVELLAEHRSATAGTELVLATRFRVAEGWHIYWRNPGDSGVQTQVLIEAPDGFEVGPTHYPGPQLFEAPGDIRTFGYEGEPVLLTELQVPPSAAGKARLRAQVRWLACRSERCVPGTAELSVAVPIRARARTASHRRRGLFAQARARLPKPWPPSEQALLEPAPVGLRIQLPDSTARLTFFPDAETESLLTGWPTGAPGRLELPLNIEPQRLTGVLRVDDPAATAWYDLNWTPRP